METLAQVITVLTPVYVPLIVAWIKRFKLPTWGLPIIAIALGALADVINELVTGLGQGWQAGAALGAAGIGVRELVDQLRKATIGSGPVSFLLIPLLLSGCALYQQDPVGATLLTLNKSYGVAIRTAGEAFQNGALTKQQLIQFVNEAEKFHVSYKTARGLYEAGKLTDKDQRLAALRVSLNALESLLQKLIIKKGTVTLWTLQPQPLLA